VKSSAPCTYLPWDSQFFGLRIGQVTSGKLSANLLFDILVWCDQNQITCLYFLADADHPPTHRLAEQAGFKLVDIRLTLQHTLVANPEAAPDQTTPAPQVEAAIRPARLDDLPILEDLASENLRSTRFYADLCFSRQACRHLYQTWIRNDVEGDADLVLVLEGASGVVGFLTCHLSKMSPHGPHGSIGLVAVDSHNRGRGAGSALVQAALSWFARQGAEQVEVVTQGRNVPALRLYERCGFRTQSVQLWYHKWFVDCP